MTAEEGYGHYIVRREYRAQRRVLQIPINQPQVAHFDWRDTPINLAEGDELTINYPANNTEEEAQVVEWTLTDVFHRPNQDTVYIGLGNRGVPEPGIREQVRENIAQRMAERLDADLLYGTNNIFAPGHTAELALGGFVVPPDIAAEILDQHEDDRPESIEIVNGFDDVHSILNFADFKKVAATQGE
jgi:hypothetical protein